MITKQRLKELIEQGATIWHIVGKNIFNLNANNVPTFYTLSDKNWDVWKDDYFETEEDAEFALRYKRIPKTEYLDLPTWEEFKKLGEFTFYGFHQGKIKMFYSISDDNIKIDTGIDWYVFSKKYNKENYIDACQLCKNLFLGEEVC